MIQTGRNFHASIGFKVAILLGLLVLPNFAFAHARLLPGGSLPPRNTNAGLKTGPCGGVARTLAPKSFVAGQDITVEWEETVNHPGRFEFYFSEAGDTNFQLLKSVPDTQDSGDPPHRYSTSLTLPNLTCTACTIQMIQVMTENPALPRNYYSCADIQLTATPTQPGPNPIPTPSPTPSPTPGPSPAPATPSPTPTPAPAPGTPGSTPSPSPSSSDKNC